MGFFDSVVDTVRNNSAVGWLTDQTFGKGAVDTALGVQKPPEAPGPEPVDPKLKEIRDKQISEAKKFRENVPGYQKKLGDQAELSSRRRLAEKLGGVKSDFNRKGLLYSGIRQSGEVGAQADASNQLAQEKAMINDQLNQTADEYEAAALKSGLAVNDMEHDFQQQLYSRALASMMSRNQGLGAVLGAGGAVGGAALAKGSK